MKTLLKILSFVLLATAALAVDKPVSPTSAPKAPEKKKVYELPKTGVNQRRSTDGWLNLEVSGIRLIVKFYDNEKKPVPPNVDRGFAQFRYSSRNPARAPLNREGDTLATPAKLVPPHNFLVLIGLFSGDGAEPVESYTIKYP